jgi:hypothetical protein
MFYIIRLIKAIFGQDLIDPEREEKLAEFVHEILAATRDGNVDTKELKSIRSKGYDLLIDLGFDKFEPKDVPDKIEPESASQSAKDTGEDTSGTPV